LPSTTATGGGFDPMKHLSSQPGGDGSSWVPERAATPPEQPGPHDVPPTAGGAFIQPPGSTPGRSIKPWQVVGGLALVFVPLLVWFASSLSDPAPGPVSEPRVAVSVSPSQPTSATAPPVTSSASSSPTADPLPPVVTPNAPRDFPSLPTALTASTLPTGRGATSTSRPVLTAPPSLLPAPTVSITAIPPGAKTIRFEAQAAGDEKVEVSLSDATHQRFDYPLQKAPLAFEVPVGPTPSSSDYFSLRVRTPYDSSATRRPDVACRILVDGVVVTSQQGQGYVTCYISPYYDVRRT
ncbi:MAG: hypothetical protein L0H96_02720, partial [Humibacillus sp.]|nr:hypothetical protein [Humibacillus sp.]